MKVDLTENDVKRAEENAACPWFADDRCTAFRGWQKEIQGLLNNGFKMGVEAMINYVTEEYVPESEGEGLAGGQQ